MITTSEIFELLKQPTPLSIVRVGDAEGIVLSMYDGQDWFDFGCRDVFYAHTGYMPSREEAIAVRDNLIDALTHADILGLPKFGAKQTKYWQMIRPAIEKYVPNCSDKWCNIDIHLEFLEGGLFKPLIDHYGSLNYISCRNLDDKFGVPVNSFITAPEWKFTPGYTGPRQYPDQYNEIIKWMGTLDAKNNLLLYGSGVIGKQYGNWWRDKGGIAFDIGSVFDSWAGKVTRGEGRGADVEGGDYKL